MDDLFVERVAVASIAYEGKTEDGEVDMQRARERWGAMLPSRKEAKREQIRIIGDWIDRAMTGAKR